MSQHRASATAAQLDDANLFDAFVPAPGPAGVLQTHRLHELHGVARLVVF